MIQIGTIDANDMLIETELDDSVFNLGISWNESGKFWTLSIRDLNLSVLASGIPLVPNYPLLRQIRQPEFPAGDIVVISINDAALTRQSFTNNEAFIFYVPLSDLGLEDG